MPYNILIADDFDINRSVVRSILDKRLEEAVFYEAENGHQVMSILSGTAINLIILDLMMPEMDGFQVLRALEKQDLLKGIPVIVNSSLEDIQSIQQALELGALDYFTKPLTQNEMNITLPLKVRNALKYEEQKNQLVHYNRRMNREHELAKLFQTSLMTKSRVSEKTEMYGRYLPCNKIGGDFYEYIEIDGKQWFIIADVCGHGVVAAMLSSMIKVIFGHFVRTYSSPSEVLQNLNATFCTMLGESNVLYFSAFIGLIENDRLRYSNAGHFYPMIINTEKKTLRKLKQKSLFIGIMQDACYEDSMDEVTAGDCIVSYTDGLFDGGPHQDLNWEQVYENSLSLSPLLRENPEAFIDTLIREVYGDVGEGYWDDISVMVIKIK